MQTPAADDAAEPRGASDVAVVEPPSTSGAHWAHRDEILHRRAGAPSAPFRRPPAVNSFPADPGVEAASQQTESWDAFAPSDNSRGKEAAWEATGETPAASPFLPPPLSDGGSGGPWSEAAHLTGAASDAGGPSTSGGRRPHPVAEGPMGGTDRVPPADRHGDAQPATADAPATPGRASFGMSGGPIGGPRNAPTSPAAPPQPSIGEFITGPGREIRPHRASRRDSAASGGTDHTPSGGTPTAAPRRSRLVTGAIVALSTVVLLAGAVAGVVFFADTDGGLTSVLRLGAGDTDGKVVTAPLGGRTAAGFEMAAATTKVTVRSQDLGEDLYKITSMDDSDTVPRPSISDDKVQLRLSAEGDGAGGTVEVLLSTKVTWSLRFVGAADEQIVDFTGGRISSVDLAGGTRRVDLTLPTPTGTVPVRVTGAIDDLSVTSPAGNPVRVQVDGGAKTVAAGRRTLRDVEPGSTLTPTNWQVNDRYDMAAAARLTLLSIRTAP